MFARYDGIELAKYVVNRCMDKGTPISNLQLQKILYYIQKKFLSNDELAFMERIEAWQYGPVVPVVYNAFCGGGAMPIRMRYPVLLKGDMRCIDEIVDSKRQLDPWNLVNDTHKQGGAWDRIYQNGSGNHQIIPIGYIKNYG